MGSSISRCRECRPESLRSAPQPGGVERGLVADGDDLVDHAAIEDRWDEAGADALDLVRPRSAAGKNGRVFGFDRDHAAPWLAGPQNLADPGDGPAGAD